MKLKKYGKRMFLTIAMCMVMTACQADRNEKVTQQSTDANITESVSEITGIVENEKIENQQETEIVNRSSYIGYLDESPYYEDVNSVQDYDGDGMNDRIWRDLSDGESYTIHFGNGDKLLITDDFNGNWLDCYIWPMTEEMTLCWFQETGMSTGGDWMKLYLYEQTESGLRRMELPEGPSLKAEAVSEREIGFSWGEHAVGTFSLDTISSVANFTVEEWLERRASLENGEYVFKLSWYDTCAMMDGSVPEREAIQWHSYYGDKWSNITFVWTTEYVDGAWQVTSVNLR